MYCLVLNKFLKEPLTCLGCLGYLGIKTGGDNIKKWHMLAKRADLITVDSKFMQEFYHTYNPILLPAPMETDVLVPCSEKEDYLFYTGRLSFEKNPFGFVDIINKTGLKGKMAVYDTVDDVVGSNNYYKDILNCDNKNIEVFLNPTKEKMIDLVRHARFTVLPYFFAEPFGNAAANSVMCGTPLITFPYGNARNMTHLLPKTLDEMIKMVEMDDKQYEIELRKTIIKSNELRTTHNPVNSTKLWDDAYEKLIKEH